MATQDLKNRVTITQSMAPKATLTAATNGTSVDMSGFEGCLVIYNIGVVAGAPIVILQESDDDSTFTTVAAGDQSTTMPAALSTSLDVTTYEAAYLGGKRYVRPRVSDEGTSIFIAVTIVQSSGLHINA